MVSIPGTYREKTSWGMQQLALKITQAGGLLHDHKFLVTKVPKDDQSGLTYMVLGGNHHVKVHSSN
jgi:hypothetical protein